MCCVFGQDTSHSLCLSVSTQVHLYKWIPDFLYLHVIRSIGMRTTKRQEDRYLYVVCCIFVAKNEICMLMPLKKRLHASLPFLHWVADEGNNIMGDKLLLNFGAKFQR